MTRARTGPLALRGPALSLNHAFHLELERAQLLRVVMLTPGQSSSVCVEICWKNIRFKTRSRSLNYLLLCLCSKHPGRAEELWTNQKQGLLSGRSLHPTTL